MASEKADDKHSFKKVLGDELDEIKISRAARLKPEDNNSGESSSDPYARAHEMNLVGLAFSGGGIRSATFNLGVVQALARLRLLRSIDYLSTVSGGGYIGSWLTAWTKRVKSIHEVERELAPRGISGPKPDESERVRFLRRFSNYLTPKLGMFSADTWALISTYLRNLSLNLTIFILFFAAVFMVPYMAVWGFRWLVGGMPQGDGWPLFSFTMLSLAVGVFFMSLNQTYWSVKSRTSPTGKIYFPWYTKQMAVLWLIVLPISASCMTASVWLSFFNADRELRAWLAYAGIAVAVYVGSWIIGWIKAYLCSFFSLSSSTGTAEEKKGFTKAAADAVAGVGSDIVKRVRGTSWSEVKDRTIYFIVMLASSAAGIGFFYLLIRLFRSWEHPESQIWYVVAFGMPLVMLVLMAIMTLHIGLLGRGMPDESREWWSRVGGWYLIFMIIWMVFCSLTFFGLPLLARARILGAALLGAGWLGSTITGLVLGKSTLTEKKEPNRVIETIAKAVPYVFVFGLLLLFSLIVYAIAPLTLDGQQTKMWDFYWDHMWNNKPDFSELVLANFYIMNFAKGTTFIGTFAGALLLVFFLSCRFDPNQFSLHLLYRNRLTRCYLGASNADRSEQPTTGFDTRDDIELSSVSSECNYVGPYPIINTTLNLVTGKQLAWQQRKGASFIFTPRYCGYELNVLGSNGPEKISGYQPTWERLQDKGGILLGETMAISGAAASPNMGYHSSAPLAFLMTVFNVRLGWWSANPHKRKTWIKAQPKMGLLYLLKELFGMTDNESDFIYLSDGGHFENLGIYELVRRRCRTIIVSDAGCDPRTSFDDLANAMRKIRVDLGISIDIKLEDIKNAKKACVVGDILYEEKDAKGSPVGKLVYLKPVICGKESVDVLSYQAATDSGKSRFPHQTTADQWFDETQFESYRMLGYHAVRSIYSKEEPISIEGFVKEAEKEKKEPSSGPEGCGVS